MTAPRQRPLRAHVFITFWGFDMINESTMDDLKLTMLGNTATHVPQGLGAVPGMTKAATPQVRESFADVGLPEVLELLQQVVDSGAHLWACRMPACMQRLEEKDLFDEVEAIVSASDFIGGPTGRSRGSSDPDLRTAARASPE